MTANDDLLSVLYTSTARSPFGDDELAELLTRSRASNERHELTGMLLYRGGRFVQVLEGPAERVRDLLAVIATDERHTAMRVLIEQPIERREFADWTMGYQPIAVTTAPAPAGFRDTFDDLEQSGDPSATLRAARELSLWFRVRERRAQSDAR
ncbi:BLUF domain-containing protein [Microbacterium radiodurans]|uniref:BLUF domain-containing protein n=1 Tax=Microbacterium radiodurans TaxID=661398 RepID=A0A5J5IU17_9MICO|nr:BLUF domain-containing protein [Microbacterium radiodurans]KAA9089069.1 BLUF domain-containing protein [Microbacterium radiodurans]